MTDSFLFPCRSVASSNEYDATSTPSSQQPAATSPFWSSATMATAGSTPPSNQQHGNQYAAAMATE